MPRLGDAENPVTQTIDGRIEPQPVRQLCPRGIIVESIATRSHDADSRAIRRNLHSASTQRPVERHMRLLAILRPTQTSVEAIATRSYRHSSLQLKTIPSLQLGA